MDGLNHSVGGRDLFEETRRTGTSGSGRFGTANPELGKVEEEEYRYYSYYIIVVS